MLILHHVDSEHTVGEHIAEQIFRHKIERIIGRKTEQHNPSSVVGSIWAARTTQAEALPLISAFESILFALKKNRCLLFKSLF